MPDTDLTALPADQLAAELARRERESQQQQADAQAAWKAEQADRARAVLDTWQADEAQLHAAEQNAYDEFRRAVLDDPTVAAWIRYRWHRYRRTNLRTEAQLAANLLGEADQHRIIDLTYRDPRLIDDILDLADKAAEQQAADDHQLVADRLQNPGTHPTGR